MIKTILSTVLISASLFCIGCQDDDDEPINCTNWQQAIAPEFQAAADAGDIWDDDTSNTQNCNDYKVA